VPLLAILLIVQIAGPPRESEDVYRTVLADARCSGRGTPVSRGSIPVIHRELSVEPSFVTPLRGVLPTSLVDALSRARDDRPILDDSTAQRLNVITIEPTDVEALTKATDYWAAFFNKFPSASAQVRLSPVAFDGEAREALVYCEYSVSPIGGEGFIVHLRQTSGTWTALAWHRIWIS